MRRIVIALALAALAQGTTCAQDKTAVISSVHQFVDAFNKGDSKTLVAACAEKTSIIDEFPPYAWHGAGGCAKWANDYDADAKKNAVTDGVVKLDSPAARGYRGRSCLCRCCGRLNLQAKGEGGEGDRLDPSLSCRKVGVSPRGLGLRI